VFDDENGVAEIAEILEGRDETLVVALMQPDGGLIEDVKDAAEARADLRGEAYALAFAAGEGCGGAVERQIAEAYSVEELEALDDLPLQAIRDEALTAGGAPGFVVGMGIVTARDSGRRRLPWQRGQVVADMYCIMYSR